MKKLTLITTMLIILSLLFASCGASSADYNVSAKSEEYNYNSYESSDNIYTDSVNKAEQMLVYTVAYRVESTDFDDTAARYETELEKLGGYVESSSISTGELRSAYYTFRVPTSQLDAFLDIVDGLGNVTRKSVSEDDYSGIYYDYQTELDLLKLEESYIQKYLDEATDSVERTELIRQLLDVKREIRTIENQSKDIEEIVLYSTVNIDLDEVESYSDITINYGESLGYAFVDSWVGFAEFCKGFLYTLVYMLPALLVIAVIVTVIILLVKNGRKKRRKAEKARYEAAINQQMQNVTPEPVKPDDTKQNK